MNGNYHEHEMFRFFAVVLVPIITSFSRSANVSWQAEPFAILHTRDICIGKTFSGKWSVHTAISSGSEMYTQLGTKQLQPIASMHSGSVKS